MSAIAVVGLLAALLTQPAVDAVRQAEASRLQALLSRDVAALDRLLGADLTYTHSNAKVDDKPTYLEPFLAGRTRYLRLEPSDVVVRVYGDAAVLTGRMLSVALVNGAESRTDLRFISVWVNRDGRWQMVAWHSARLPGI